MEINNDINEIVYMKRDIKSHRIYEKHPNLMFGVIILVWGFLFFFGCFSDVYWVYWMFLVIIIVPITIWYIKNNEKTNLTKSSAFIERDGIIYYIRLGYTLDYQQSGIPFVLKNKIIMKNAKYSINANLVYKNGYSGKNVNIAVLDTGVFKHKQLDGCIKHFMDFVGGKETCYDDNGHGTHVCGILSAADIGMAPGAGLYVFKVLDYLGMGQTLDSIRALNYIKENCVRLNIKILNFSVGYLPYSDTKERVKILKLIDELWDMGVVVVAAAGNYGPAPFSVTVPGISRKIITVGSFDDIRSGKGPTDCCIVKPEILAPGHDIISLGTRDGTYVRKTGTSMATPIVSGAIALMLEKNPAMRPEEVKLALYNTCDRAKDSHKGSWGIINVDKLVGIL